MSPTIIDNIRTNDSVLTKQKSNYWKQPRALHQKSQPLRISIRAVHPLWSCISPDAHMLLYISSWATVLLFKLCMKEYQSHFHSKVRITTIFAHVSPALNKINIFIWVHKHIPGAELSDIRHQALHGWSWTCLKKTSCRWKSDYSGALYFHVQLMGNILIYIHKYSSYCRILQHYRSLLHNYCECTTPDKSNYTCRWELHLVCAKPDLQSKFAVYCCIVFRTVFGLVFSVQTCLIICWRDQTQRFKMLKTC